MWRLIPLLNAPGSTQMAIDSWLLAQHLQGGYPSTLRFYTWMPIAISLGYHQRHGIERWNTLTWNGAAIDLVRRPTGGRAVLHSGDLTYAIVTSSLSSQRMETYQKLCEFLIQGWRSLGVALRYGQSDRGYSHNPNCFGTATGADLVLADGTKLIGSAQRYRDQSVLQQGSMQFAPNAALFEQVFGVPPQVSIELRPFQNQPSVESVINALVESAKQCFATEFQVQPLSENEWAAIADHSKRAAP